jgi:hypothetical protein
MDAEMTTNKTFCSGYKNCAALHSSCSTRHKESPTLRVKCWFKMEEFYFCPKLARSYSESDEFTFAVSSSVIINKQKW